MLGALGLTVLQSSSGGAAMIILLVILLSVLVGFLIVAGMAYWTYKDATKRGMDNAALWAVVVFLLGLIGVVIYLLVRE